MHPLLHRHRVLPLVLLLAWMWPSWSQAHPAPLAQARLQIETAQRRYELHLDCDVTAMVMGHAPGHLTDDLAAQLEKLTQEQLKVQVDRVASWISSQLELRVDGRLLEPAEVVMPEAAMIRSLGERSEDAVPTRQSTVVVRGPWPAKGGRLTVRLPGEAGAAVLLTKLDARDLPVQLLSAGQTSQPMSVGELMGDPQTPSHDESTAASGREGIPPGVITAGQFLALGFWHIIPDGPDHVLFVLGLFLLSAHWRPLLWQVTAFTAAHSVTLALAMYDIVRLPANIVEPLIAASIAFIAIENLFTTKLQPWRPIVVFAFGLLHGLGFAGVLSDLDLPAGQFAPAILGFNLGVEAGQLAVIGLAFLAVGWWRDTKGYRTAVIIPASLLIAAIGLYWTVERII